MRLGYNTIKNNSERSLNIAAFVPARLASLRNSSRIIFRLSQSGLNFTHSLLHKQGGNPRRTSSRPATLLKGQENGNLSKYCKSDCSVDDNRCRWPELPAGLEKSARASLPEFLRLKGIIKDKLPFLMNIVKKKIDEVKKCLRTNILKTAKK